MDERRYYRRRRNRWVIGLLLVAAVAGCIVTFLVNPWSRLFNREVEIDLHSGRVRYTRHVLFVEVDQEVRPTPLSEAAGLAPAEAPEWARVATFGPSGGHSPHYVHHGALGEINTLGSMWEAADFDPAARTKTARQLLRVWAESYRATDTYLGLLTEEASPLSARSGPPVTAADIPDDLPARALAAWSGRSN